MALYQSLVGGADLNTYGNWPFNGFLNPFNHTYIPAESNATRLVFSHPDGTSTHINGTGLTIDGVGGIRWTQLSTIQRIATDGTVLEIISDLDGIALTPIIYPDAFGLRDIFPALMSGDDIIIGSSGSDWLRGGAAGNSQPAGNDTFYSGGGADQIVGGNGNDTFVIQAGDIVPGLFIEGAAHGGVDTLHLQNVGSVDLRNGITGIEVLEFASGVSSVLARDYQFTSEIIGSGQGDTIVFENGGFGFDLSTLTFTNWTAGQDTITIKGSATGTTQNDIFLMNVSFAGALFNGSAGDDVFIFDSTTTARLVQGGVGLDIIQVDGATLDFTVYAGDSRLGDGIEVLAFGDGGSIVTLTGAQISSGIMPTIVGGAGVDTLVIVGNQPADLSHIAFQNWTDGQDVVHHQGINGLSVVNTLLGSDVSETFTAYGANGDYIEGRGGNDTIQGGGGDNDTAGYSGSSANYWVRYDALEDAYTVTDRRNGSPDGVDTLRGIETLSFSDGNFAMADLIPNEILGTEFDDSGATALHGTMGDDIIYGLAGNDEIYGGSGINIYFGGAGDDDFFGATFANSENHDIADYSDATGPIYVYLDTENGYVTGTSVGNDTLYYIDRIVGTAFDDVFDVGSPFGIQAHIEGGAGNDQINGNGWQTVVRYTSAAAGVTVDLEVGTAYSTDPGDAAGIGVDTLNFISEVRGSDYGDTLLGSNSFTQETFRGRGGADVINGRDGWDVADYSGAASGVVVDLGASGIGSGVASDDGDGASDILLSIEAVDGSDHADDITGDDRDNALYGRAGNDILIGAGGDDYLEGGDGSDQLLGGTGDDELLGGNENDILIGGTGINFLGGENGTDTAIFEGNRADYEIYQQIVYQQVGSQFAEIVLIDTRTGLPEDTIHFTSSIETFSFADGDLTAGMLNFSWNTVPETAGEFFVVRPGDTVSYNILANDFDADGDTLELLAVESIWSSDSGGWTFDVFGNVTFYVPQNAGGELLEFEALVWDGKGGAWWSSLTLQVIPDFNAPPTANPDIYPTPATDNLLFLGFTPESGPEFYKLGNDGTLNQVTSSGLTGGVSQAEPYLFGGALYFTAVDPVTGKEQVWRGIDGEIELVTRLNNAGNGIRVQNFVEFDGGLYFYAEQAPSTGSTGFGGIFRIDENGAVSQITDPFFGGDPNFFYQPVILGGNLVFGGGTETSGPQWWSIDETGAVSQLSNYAATLRRCHRRRPTRRSFTMAHFTGMRPMSSASAKFTKSMPVASPRRSRRSTQRMVGSQLAHSTSSAGPSIFRRAD
ncbi:MAG: hypothetical protein B7Y80_10095 [Hyphomicrobium sp. 32-62-53]|nr:MAG: hypothetical protein B7Z29_08630 [Hyphomicrobium sp. 12-62-95]OYX99917.1 MAG: hypothetical protein B7Y80_10095 [Hyphomicrobium sp. 32-62-53]